MFRVGRESEEREDDPGCTRWVYKRCTSAGTGGKIWAGAYADKEASSQLTRKMIMMETRRSSHIRTSSRGRGPHLTEEERQEAQKVFLEAFADCGNIRQACALANVDRSTVSNWVERDEDFNLEYTLKKQDVDDAIRAEIFRRAMFGEKEYVISMGKLVYGPDGEPLTTSRKSDTLLMFHARSRMQEYREKKNVEHSGSIDVAGAKELLLARLAGLTQVTVIEAAKEEQERDEPADG